MNRKHRLLLAGVIFCGLLGGACRPTTSAPTPTNQKLEQEFAQANAPTLLVDHIVTTLSTAICAHTVRCATAQKASLDDCIPIAQSVFAHAQSFSARARVLNQNIIDRCVTNIATLGCDATKDSFQSLRGLQGCEFLEAVIPEAPTPREPEYRTENQKKYLIVGTITDGSGYPNNLFVYGYVWATAGTDGYDKCLHVGEPTNIFIMNPSPKNVTANTYYRGKHCCYDMTSNGTNAFGAPVRAYWYGPCDNERAEQSFKNQPSKSLADLQVEIKAWPTEDHALGQQINWRTATDGRVQTIKQFFAALHDANGVAANQYVHASKANQGFYAVDAITARYGGLEEKVTLVDVYQCPTRTDCLMVSFVKKAKDYPRQLIIAQVDLVEVDGRWWILNIENQYWAPPKPASDGEATGC